MKFNDLLVLFVVLVVRFYLCEAWSLGGLRVKKNQPSRCQQPEKSWFLSTTSMTRYATNSNHPEQHHGSEFKHCLAILTMPHTSIERIANEAILDTAVKHGAPKFSVVLRIQGKTPSLASLRRYVGEVYSALWDVAMASGNPDVLDVVVYPQNLPNAAPEQWINHQPDLDCVCSHDSICGWVSESALGRGLKFQSKQGDGVGGLDAHVAALNADRAQRNLKPVKALHVEAWPSVAASELHQAHNIDFIDDDLIDHEEQDGPNGSEEECEISSLIGGARIPTKSLYERVACGGTFDGMHYGHRKLLTLAVSSVNPATGRLLIGVTKDEMLRHKQYAEYIPSIQERIDGVREFIYRLAPGIKNHVKIVPIADAFGPPGTREGEDFDALVLSHETLENGCRLNEHRERMGFRPLTLLCTRRTEPHGMSSTNLRRLRSEKLKGMTSAKL